MKPLILSFLILMTIAAHPAAANELQEMRTGKYGDFVRLVFQFKTPARFEVENDTGAAKLSLVMMDTVLNLDKNQPGAFPEPVETVQIQPNGPHLTARIAVSTTGYRLKSFALENPARVVLDIYPVSVPESEVVLNPMVTAESKNSVPEGTRPAEPVSPPKQPVPEPVEAVAVQTAEAGTPAPASGETVKENTALHTEKPAAKASQNPKTAQPAEAPGTVSHTEPIGTGETSTPKTGRFQQYLIAILAAISIVILTLVGFMIFQKTQSTDSTAADQAREELRTTADIMASIDAKIKDKFKQYETSNQD